MKKKVIDDLIMSKYIGIALSKENINIDNKLILKILDYELDYLKSQGLVKWTTNTVLFRSEWYGIFIFKYID